MSNQESSDEANPSRADRARTLRAAETDGVAGVAERVGDYLFTDGSGAEVERLVISRRGEDKGRSGWGKRPVVDAVQFLLNEARSNYQKRLYDECVAAKWDPEQRNTFAEEIAHLHEELSEAFRAWRLYKDFDVHVGPNGKPEGIPIELADVLIGLFYNAELHGFDLFAAVEEKHRFNLTRNYVAEDRQLHATKPDANTAASAGTTDQDAARE